MKLTRGGFAIVVLLLFGMLHGIYGWLGAATSGYSYAYIDLLSPLVIVLPVAGVLFYFGWRCDQPVLFGLRAGISLQLAALLPLYYAMATYIFSHAEITGSFLCYLGGGLFAANLLALVQIWKMADPVEAYMNSGWTVRSIVIPVALGVGGHGIWILHGPWVVIRNHGFSFFAPKDTCMGLGGAGCSYIEGNMHFWGVTGTGMMWSCALGLALVLILLALTRLGKAVQEG